jgi:hypothetical protein
MSLELLRLSVMMKLNLDEFLTVDLELIGENDYTADYSKFGMNWNHMIDAALEQPFKWRHWNLGA